MFGLNIRILNQDLFIFHLQYITGILNQLFVIMNIVGIIDTEVIVVRESVDNYLEVALYVPFQSKGIPSSILSSIFA